MAIIGQNSVLNQYAPAFCVNSPVLGETLVYDSVTNSFKNKALTLDDLDIGLVEPHELQWTNTYNPGDVVTISNDLSSFTAVPKESLGGGEGAYFLNDLFDVEITGTIEDRSLLIYDVSSDKWVKSFLDYNELVNTPTEFTPAEHTHLEEDITNLDKYTQSQVDSLLLNKQDLVTGVENNYVSFDVDGNMHDSGTSAVDFATAAQGLLADTAVQPGDNVSTLVNDAGYITSAESGIFNVIEDLTPQLGGVLDVLGNDITNSLALGRVSLDGLLWPALDGLAGDVLTTDGLGSLSFTTPAEPGIADAPEDGATYGRNTGAWVKVAREDQGDLADTAVQPGDNVSVLVNDPGYLIPGDNVSALTNDSLFIPEGDLVSKLANDAGYITSAESGITQVSDDLTPVLGGSLDVRALNIFSSTTYVTIDGLAWPLPSERVDAEDGWVLATDGVGGLYFTEPATGGGGGETPTHIIEDEDGDTYVSVEDSSDNDAVVVGLGMPSGYRYQEVWDSSGEGIDVKDPLLYSATRGFELYVPERSPGNPGDGKGIKLYAGNALGLGNTGGHLLISSGNGGYDDYSGPGYADGGNTYIGAGYGLQGGRLILQAGDSYDGQGGPANDGGMVSIRGGWSDSNNPAHTSGPVLIETYENSNGGSGAIDIITGNSGSIGGNSGDINITTGTGNVGRGGHVTIQTGGSTNSTDTSDIILKPSGSNGVDSSVIIALHSDSNTPTELKFATSDQSIGLRAPDTAATPTTYILPVNDGTDGQVLSTDGAGQLSFITVSGGGGTGDVEEAPNDGLQYVRQSEDWSILGSDNITLKTDVEIFAEDSTNTPQSLLNFRSDIFRLGTDNYSLSIKGNVVSALTFTNGVPVNSFLVDGITKGNLIWMSDDDHVIVGDSNVTTAIRTLDVASDPVVRQGVFGSTTDYKIYHEGNLSLDGYITDAPDDSEQYVRYGENWTALGTNDITLYSGTRVFAEQADGTLDRAIDYSGDKLKFGVNGIDLQLLGQLSYKLSFDNNRAVVGKHSDNTTESSLAWVSTDNFAIYGDGNIVSAIRSADAASDPVVRQGDFGETEDFTIYHEGNLLNVSQLANDAGYITSAGTVPEAPNDDEQYLRRNRAWVGLGDYNISLAPTISISNDAGDNLISHSVSAPDDPLFPDATFITIGEGVNGINIESVLFNPLKIKNDTAIQGYHDDYLLVSNLLSITPDNIVMIGDDTARSAIRSVDAASDPIVRQGIFGSTTDYKIYHEGFAPTEIIDGESYMRVTNNSPALINANSGLTVTTNGPISLTNQAPITLDTVAPIEITSTGAPITFDAVQVNLNSTGMFNANTTGMSLNAIYGEIDIFNTSFVSKYNGSYIVEAMPGTDGAGQVIKLDGADSATGSGTDIFLEGGTGSTASGGGIYLNGGNGDTGGDVFVSPGDGVSGRGGNVHIDAGTSNASDGGHVYINAGNTSSATDTDIAGGITLTARHGGNGATPGDITFNPGGDVIVGLHSSDNTPSEMKFASNAGFVGFKTTTTAVDQTYILPDTDGEAGEVLSTDGAGQLSFVPAVSSFIMEDAQDASRNIAGTTSAFQFGDPLTPGPTETIGLYGYNNVRSVYTSTRDLNGNPVDHAAMDGEIYHIFANHQPTQYTSEISIVISGDYYQIFWESSAGLNAYDTTYLEFVKDGNPVFATLNEGDAWVYNSSESLFKPKQINTLTESESITATTGENLLSYSISAPDDPLFPDTTFVNLGEENTGINIASTLFNPLKIKNDTAIQGWDSTYSSLYNAVSISTDDFIILGDSGITTALRALDGDNAPIVRQGTFGATTDYKIYHEGNLPPAGAFIMEDAQDAIRNSTDSELDPAGYRYLIGPNNVAGGITQHSGGDVWQANAIDADGKTFPIDAMNGELVDVYYDNEPPFQVTMSSVWLGIINIDWDGLTYPASATTSVRFVPADITYAPLADGDVWMYNESESMFKPTQIEIEPTPFIMEDAEDASRLEDVSIPNGVRLEIGTTMETEEGKWYQFNNGIDRIHTSPIDLDGVAIDPVYFDGTTCELYKDGSATPEIIEVTSSWDDASFSRPVPVMRWTPMDLSGVTEIRVKVVGPLIPLKHGDAWVYNGASGEFNPTQISDFVDIPVTNEGTVEYSSTFMGGAPVQVTDGIFPISDTGDFTYEIKTFIPSGAEYHNIVSVGGNDTEYYGSLYMYKTNSSDEIIIRSSVSGTTTDGSSILSTLGMGLLDKVMTITIVKKGNITRTWIDGVVANTETDVLYNLVPFEDPSSTLFAFHDNSVIVGDGTGIEIYGWRFATRALYSVDNDNISTFSIGTSEVVPTPVNSVNDLKPMWVDVDGEFKYTDPVTGEVWLQTGHTLPVDTDEYPLAKSSLGDTFLYSGVNHLLANASYTDQRVLGERGDSYWYVLDINDNRFMRYRKSDWGFNDAYYGFGQSGRLSFCSNGNEWIFAWEDGGTSALSYGLSESAKLGHAEVSSGEGIAWNNAGSQYGIVSATDLKIAVYSDAWVHQLDIDVSGQTSSPAGIYFDGVYWLIIDNTTKVIHQYATDGQYTGNTFSVGVETANPTSLYYLNSVWYILDHNVPTPHVFEYTGAEYIGYPDPILLEETASNAIPLHYFVRIK